MCAQSSRNRKVLVCNTPNTSLYVKKTYQEVGIGTSYIAGCLEHCGYDVDYFDFNAALNRWREDRPLPQPETDILCSKDQFLNYYHSPEPSQNLLRIWLDCFHETINVRGYHYMFLGFDRRDTSSLLNISVLHFGLLMAKSIKEKISAPIIVGGKHCLRYIGPRYCRDLIKALGEIPVDVIFRRASHTSLPAFLDKLEKNEIQLPLENPLNEEHSNFIEMRHFIPKYEFINQNDVMTSVHELFPKAVLDKYPKLSEVEPFLIGSYKFTLGCPFTCAFCEDGAVSHLNRFEISTIIEHLYQFSAQGVCQLRWLNNNINLSIKHALDLCDQIIKNQLGILFSDSCNTWVVSEELFKKLGEAGCIRLWYGIENPNARILKYLNKSNVKRENVLRVFSWAASANIWNSANLIYNFPHETNAEFNDLLQFITRRDLVDTFQRSHFMVLSNSPMSLDPEKFGIKIRQISSNGTVGAYDEIGGLSWEQKQALGYTKYNQIYEVRSELEQIITWHDHLLFATRIAGYDRKTTKQIFDDFLSLVQKQGVAEDYIRWLGPKVPYGYGPEHPSSAIMRNLVSDSDQNAEFIVAD